MPQYANSNWHNAHNFYGDLNDLDAATLGDQFKNVTPALIQKTAQEYLRTGNRTILIIEPTPGS